jgi:hypothetical protein
VRAFGQPLASLRRPTLDALRNQSTRTLERLELVWPPKKDYSPVNEILTQITPAFAFWSAVVPLHPDRHPRTFELMQLALGLATSVVLRVKHALGCPRPHEVNRDIHPLILTPAHGSFPSGHATEASTVSDMLAYLLSDSAGTRSSQFGPALNTLARRIADNRVSAGVHFPVDSAAGHVLGQTLGMYFLARCGVINAPKHQRFDGLEIDSLAESTDQINSRPGVLESNQMKPIAPSALLAAHWKAARAEWAF